jgi:cytochrome b6-f complex iron-sulfur subunit
MSKEISRRSFLLYFNAGWVASCFPLVLSACQSKNASQSKSPKSDVIEVENAPIVVPTDTRPDGFTSIGTTGELDKNEHINYERVDYRKALVVRHPTQKNKLIAIDPTCPHLGCLVKLVAKEQIFQCPCHLGKFDL